MAKPPSCLFLDQGREFIIFFNGYSDLFANLLIGNMVLVRNIKKHLIASQRPMFSFVTKWCQSPGFTGIKKYGNDKRAHQLHLWSKRYVVLSLQIVFSFVRAAAAWAILERIWGFGPWSETTALRYLIKLVTVPSFCSFTLISVWMALELFVVILFPQHWPPSYTMCRFCWDFQLGFLVPAFPQP